MPNLLLVLWLAISLVGCATTSAKPEDLHHKKVVVKLVDGSTCQTEKVNPVWYSSEIYTECFDTKGIRFEPKTDHEDFSIFGDAIAGIGAGILVALPFLL